VASLVQACSGAGGESSSNGTDPSLMLMPNCRTRRGPRRGKAPRRGPYPEAEAPEPTFSTPSQSSPDKPRHALPFRAKPSHVTKLRGVAIHYAGFNVEGDPAAIMRSIQRTHMEQRGWWDLQRPAWNACTNQLGRPKFALTSRSGVRASRLGAPGHGAGR
jgi:hypothetical protein